MVLSSGRCHGSLVSQPTCLECLDLWFITMSLDKRARPTCWEGWAKGYCRTQESTVRPNTVEPRHYLEYAASYGVPTFSKYTVSCQSILAIGKYYGRVGWSTGSWRVLQCPAHIESCAAGRCEVVQVHWAGVTIPSHTHLVTGTSHILNTTVLSALCVLVHKLWSQIV